jgi:hypothetical protein
MSLASASSWGVPRPCLRVVASDDAVQGGYLVPVKVSVQRAEAIGEGAIIQFVLRLKAAR